MALIDIFVERIAHELVQFLKNDPFAKHLAHDACRNHSFTKALDLGLLGIILQNGVDRLAVIFRSDHHGEATSEMAGIFLLDFQDYLELRWIINVRVEGLEPPRLAASDPKSDTSTNFAIPA